MRNALTRRFYIGISSVVVLTLAACGGNGGDDDSGGTPLEAKYNISSYQASSEDSGDFTGTWLVIINNGDAKISGTGLSANITFNARSIVRLTDRGDGTGVSESCGSTTEYLFTDSTVSDDAGGTYSFTDYNHMRGRLDDSEDDGETSSTTTADVEMVKLDSDPDFSVGSLSQFTLQMQGDSVVSNASYPIECFNETTSNMSIYFLWNGEAINRSTDDHTTYIYVTENDNSMGIMLTSSQGTDIFGGAQDSISENSAWIEIDMV